MTLELLAAEIVEKIRAGILAGECPSNLTDTVKHLIEREREEKNYGN